MSLTSGLLVLIALTLSPAHPPAASAQGTKPDAALSIRPESIDIELLYSGERVHAAGTVPAHCDLVLVCSGKNTSVKLKKKGRVGGVLWMSLEELEIDPVPGTYLLASSRALAEIAPQKTLAPLGVGFAALARKAAIEPNGKDREAIFAEFIALKKEEGLYACREGAVQLEPDRGGAMRFDVDFSLPAKATAGEYRITLFGFENGAGRVLGSRSFKIQTVGVAAWIAEMAREHGLLYGVLAVVVALGAGLCAGFLFGLGSKGAH